MKTKSLRFAAVALGIGMCTMAQAQSIYTSPARWNNFRPISNTGDNATKVADQVNKVADKATKAADQAKSVTALQAADDMPELPAPVPDPEPMKAAPEMVETPSPTPEVSAYQQAVAAPWSGASAGRLPLAPWFGGVNLLFLTLEEGHGRAIATGLGSDFNTALVDPQASVGFDVTLGKYLDCGRYGLGVTYFLWNPGAESVTRLGAPGSIRASSPAYRDVEINIAAAGVDSVYDYIDGTGPVAGAAGVRAIRDVRFQGIEANLFCFGLMGAQRAPYACCNDGFLSRLRNPCRGYTRAGGPLIRACHNRVQMTASHGFRWFQIDDELEFAYNVDGTAGYQSEDIYENVDVENNLFGYQFGGRLTYCLNCRWSLNVGGKFGLYGNHAQMRHRLGTQTTLAYRAGVGTDLIDTESSDTTLATLGELDLGLGYRLNCAWTITGGYRLLGVTGVANAVDSLPTNYSSLAAATQVHADDSYVLHGGYVGLQYNW